MSSIDELNDNGTLKPALVDALRSLLFTQTYLQTLKPHHDELCQQAIIIFKPVVEDKAYYKQSKRLKKTINKPITDYFHLYQASEQHAHKIYNWHKAQMAERGFVVEGEGRCPFAVAEAHNAEAERLLIDSMATYTGISSSSIWNMKLRAELIDKVQGLLISLASAQGIELNLLKLKETEA